MATGTQRGKDAATVLNRRDMLKATVKTGVVATALSTSALFSGKSSNAPSVTSLSKPGKMNAYVLASDPRAATGAFGVLPG